MRSGSVIQFGTPMEILAKPANPFVSELIGGRNSLKMMNLITCGQVMQRDMTAFGMVPGMSLSIVPLLESGRSMPAVPIRAMAQDALSEMFRTGESAVLVTDDQQDVQGIIQLDFLLESVSDYARKR
jgi:ABC-type proline/glycine betaine transport system ATPase subunit